MQNIFYILFAANHKEKQGGEMKEGKRKDVLHPPFRTLRPQPLGAETRC